MLDIAPDVRIVDVTHDIPPFDVRAGALLLVRAVQYLPEGRSCSRSSTPESAPIGGCIAVEVDGRDPPRPRQRAAGAGGRHARRPAPASSSSTNTEYQLPAPGPTFPGRDIMAPAAAYLAEGVAARPSSGPTSTPRRSMPGLVGAAGDGDDGAIVGEVLVGRPLRQLPAQRRPRQLAAARRASPAIPSRSVSGNGIRGRPGGCTPSPTPSRRSWCCSSTPTDAAASRSTGESAAAELGLRAGGAVTLVPEGATLNGSTP